MDGNLMRFGDMYCAVWCRTTAYSSYKNVYGVLLSVSDKKCVMRAYRVAGCLANGSAFAGFLVKSRRRSNSLALISSSHAGHDDDMPRYGHWVIVQAENKQEAVAHPDVAEVQDELLNPRQGEFCGVYFMSNGNGCVKVGQTTYTLASRISQLQSGSPHRLYVCATIRSPDRKTLEKQIHASLANRRLHGEWFAMSDEEAVAVAEMHGGTKAEAGRGNQKLLLPC